MVQPAETCNQPAPWLTDLQLPTTDLLRPGCIRRICYLGPWFVWDGAMRHGFWWPCSGVTEINIAAGV